MPKIVRNSAFETNSSSSHSITIQPNSRLIPKESFVSPLVIKCINDYSTGVDGIEYWNWQEKANHMLTGILNYHGQNTTKDLALFLRVVKEYTGCVVEIQPWVDGLTEDTYMPHGYIDHESAGMYIEHMTYASIRDYIFGETSYLFAYRS